MIWYEDEVKRAEQEKTRIPFEPETLFYGSSTFRLWETLYEDFSAFRPVNLGFGGSTLAACDWFFERILHPYHPVRILFYAGDNDLGDGRTPEEVYIFFRQLMVLVDKHFPAVSFTFLSIKPSPARWHIIEQIRYANTLIKNDLARMPSPRYHYLDVFESMLDAQGHPRPELFVDDKLHLSPSGYTLWRGILLHHLTTND